MEARGTDASGIAVAWVRVDDKFPLHPKALRAGLEAVGLWLIGCCWSSAYETDGHLPEHVIPTLSGSRPELVQSLLDAGLWDRTDGGYQIHDFLVYNPPASEQKAKREAHSAKMQALRSRSRANSRAMAQSDHEVYQSGLGVGVGVGDLRSGERGPEKGGSARAALPAWLPAELWDAFRAHRRELKRPMTAQAERLLWRKLERFRTEGLDPCEVVRTSIERGWQGIFAPDGHEPRQEQEAQQETVDTSPGAAHRAAQEQARRDGCKYYLGMGEDRNGQR